LLGSRIFLPFGYFGGGPHYQGKRKLTEYVTSRACVGDQVIVLSDAMSCLGTRFSKQVSALQRRASFRLMEVAAF